MPVLYSERNPAMFTLFLIMDHFRGQNVIRHFSKHYPNYIIDCIISKDFPSLSPFPDFSLALCDRDREIRRARQANIPVIALAHESNRQESLMGTPWLVLDTEALTPDFLKEVYCRFFRLPLRILETGRCLVRELHAPDLPFLCALQEENANNPEGCFFPASCPDPASFLEEYTAHQYAFYGYGLYGIFSKRSGEFMGIAGFSPLDGEQVEIGYSLLKKWQDQKIASEILPPLLSCGRRDFDFQNIVARIPEGNLASRKLAQKNGLKIITETSDDSKKDSKNSSHPQKS